MSPPSRPPSSQGNVDHQQLRRRRFLLALATYGFNILATMTVAQVGLGDAPDGFWMRFVGLAVLINVLLAACFLSGWNLRWRDPSLTSAQIILSGLWGMVALQAFPMARPLLLMFFVPAFSFGMLRLSARQYFATAAAVMAEYAALLAYEAWARPSFNPGHEFFVWLLFGALLCWFAWFGSVVNRIRSNLRARTRELEQANRIITERSITDDLTQVYNRRHALDMMHRMVALTERHALPLSVALFDIDHFKRINDTHGHPVGDAVLRALAKRTGDALRRADLLLSPTGFPSGDHCEDSQAGQGLLARFGGEEFLVLMPGTTLEQARLAMTRISLEVTSQPIEHAEPMRVTLSAGVAQHRRGESVDAVMRRADDAMYEAKRSGRDRIVCARDDAPANQASPHA